MNVSENTSDYNFEFGQLDQISQLFPVVAENEKKHFCQKLTPLKTFWQQKSQNDDERRNFVFTRIVQNKSLRREKNDK